MRESVLLVDRPLSSRDW